MTLRFYYLSGSPFAWRVWLALEHKRIGYEMVLLSADAGDLKQAGYLAINPRGKVPAIMDEGYSLYESSAICEYMEERFADSGPLLWPRDLRDRTNGRRIVAEVDAYVYPPLRRLMEELLFRGNGEPDEAIISSSCEVLADNFRLIARSLTGGFFLGQQPSLADFTLYPMIAVLGRLDLHRPQRDFRGLMPESLKLWAERIEALPYFQKTIPPHWRVK
jgi:glutathione S-transferase